MKKNLFGAAFILCVSLVSCGEKPKPNEASVSKVESAAPVTDLKVGDKAPDFSTIGALGGAEIKFTLAEKLKDGPLVLYFFPKVFTPGCTAEAHEFAEKTADFQKLGANIIGMSADDLEGLKKFSKEECRDKFAVAMANEEIVKSYNVALAPVGNVTKRTSYVIGQDGLIKFVYSNMDYKEHVTKTYEAVTALNKVNGK